MKRLVYSLLVIGVVLALAAVAVTVQSYNDSNDGGGGMYWLPTFAWAFVSAVAIGVALLVAKRTENLID